MSGLPEDVHVRWAVRCRDCGDLAIDHPTLESSPHDRCRTSGCECKQRREVAFYIAGLAARPPAPPGGDGAAERVAAFLDAYTHRGRYNEQLEACELPGSNNAVWLQLRVSDVRSLLADRERLAAQVAAVEALCADRAADGGALLWIEQVRQALAASGGEPATSD